MTAIRRTAAALLLGVAALLASAPAAALSQADATQADATQADATQGDATLEARATRVASELRCPVCQGLSIQDSPSPLAVQMKDVIRAQLAAGRSEEEVRAYFVSKYGEWVLLEPPASGFNLVVYLLPLVALAGGILVIVRAVRRWTAAPLAGSAPDG